MKRTYVLAIDVGNTTITVGLFQGRKLLRKTKIPTHKPHLYGRDLKRFVCKPGGRGGAITDAIIASVVPFAVGSLVKAIRKVAGPPVHVTGRDVTIPIANRYKEKAEVGQDRLVNAYAAGKIYGTPAVIIDFGTAVTFDIVGKGGAYLGGLIMPGIGISLSSLYERTALLPKVALREAKSIIAKDTVNSMRGGILFGFGAMCDGLIARYRALLGANMKVIATGGNAALVKKHARSIKIIDDDLTLKGLMMLRLKKVI